MNPTPNQPNDTMNEFDKEIDHILGLCSGVDHIPCWYGENVAGKHLSGYEEGRLTKEALKQAIDRFIIGEDDQYIEMNGDASGGAYNLQSGQRNQLRLEQRLSLWGKR